MCPKQAVGLGCRCRCLVSSKHSASTVCLQVDGETVNFFVHYEIDQNTSKHALSLDNYGGEDVGSWVLLEPEPKSVPAPAVPAAEAEAGATAVGNAA